MPEIQSGDQELLKLMRAREEREARIFAQQEKERQEREANLLLRINRRKEGDAYELKMAIARQARCDHRKGTSGSGKKFKVVDYNLSRYTFQNGATRIKCEKCRMKWFKGDTKEFLVPAAGRNSERIPNHTKLSYADVWRMCDEDSTNTSGRAEIVTTAVAQEHV